MSEGWAEKKVKCVVGMGIKKALGGSQIGEVKKINKRQDGIVECGKGKGDKPGCDATGIFAQGDIAAPVIAILDVPVVADKG